MKKKYESEIMLMTASLIWGVGYVCVVWALQAGAGASYLSAMRFALASICMLPFAYKDLKKLNKGVLAMGVLLGILNTGGYYMQTIGQVYTTTTNVGFLTSTEVVLIPFACVVIIGRKLNPRSIIAAIATLIGIGFLTIKSSFHFNPGDIYVLICAIIFATYSTITDAFAKKEDPKLLVFLQFVVSAILFALIFPFTGEQAVFNLKAIANICYLAIGSNCIATLLYTHGLGRTSAERGSVIVSCTAIFAAIFGIVIFGEAFDYKIICGSALIFLSILYSENVIFPTKRQG